MYRYLLVALVALAGCKSGTESGTVIKPGSEQGVIHGAGATFPYPIYAKWFDEYQKATGVRINYQSIGSGGGIRQLLAGTVDFGATDSPMTDEQIAQAKSPILHFPTVLGAVVPTYNLPGVSAEISFTPEVLSGIFLGKIKKWNHPELRRANSGITLADDDVVVVHRADGSGTTFVWTDYLSKSSADWKKTVGSGTSVNWPAGLGAKGNEGVAGLVKQTPYSIGYVELVYALQNKMAYGKIRNGAGSFVQPNLASVTAAAASVPVPDDFRVSITNPPGADAYPVASFTWLLIPSKIDDPVKKKSLVSFLEWMLTSGQEMTSALGYAPLPPEVVAKEKHLISRIQ